MRGLHNTDSSGPGKISPPFYRVCELRGLHNAELGHGAISRRGERILRRVAPQDDQGNLPKYCVILRRSRRIRCYYFCLIG